MVYALIDHASWRGILILISMILGRKIGMTRVWDEDGNVVPSRSSRGWPCAVSQVKTRATDGYDAVRSVSAATSRPEREQAMAGHFIRLASSLSASFVRSASRTARSTRSAGVTVADFADVEKVDVIGTSEGKGFPRVASSAGVRAAVYDAWFSLPASPVLSVSALSLRASSRWRGHMGNERVTVKSFPLSASCRAEPHLGQRALSGCQK